MRAGHWPKPRGLSLAGKTVALVGFGDIGRHAAQRMLAADMRVIAYDPFAPDAPELTAVERADWPQRLPEAGGRRPISSSSAPRSPPRAGIWSMPRP